MADASRAHRDVTGVSPLGVWSAPGRVNLMGEHTDYNQGLVLPCAIDRRTWCALSPRTDRIVTARSTLTDTAGQASLDSLDPAQMRGWSAYVLGVVWAMADTGVDLSGLTGVDLTLDSQVPVGAGLSSSAALECAVALALNDHWELGLSRQELARICQLAENQVAGAPTGIMDQSASLLAAADHALFLDCHDLSSTLVPLRLAAADLAVVVIDTAVKHAHATGGYAQRRADCERGAHALGAESLRDVTLDDLDGAAAALDPVTLRRVRHVVTENARVQRTVEALGTAGPLSIGPILLESHASMRDDFEISVPELDAAVETAMEAGAIGARMTGGGFGGAAIALARTDTVDRIAQRVTMHFAASAFAAPTVFTVSAGAGARRES